MAVEYVEDFARDQSMSISRLRVTVYDDDNSNDNNNPLSNKNVEKIW